MNSYNHRFHLDKSTSTQYKVVLVLELESQSALESLLVSVSGHPGLASELASLLVSVSGHPASLLASVLQSVLGLQSESESESESVYQKTYNPILNIKYFLLLAL